ncbi:Na+/H+ antiporter NhaA [Streptomyces sp. NPDC086010]|uniref:Na+/H+ antiporter NhaA n=1 Tax=Streptomyces sp. NPDC086010 TaxID=3365745 RepID=UPI0037D11D6D
MSIGSSDFTRQTKVGATSPSPLRTFLRTESGSAVALVAATLAALVWANVAASGYEDFWLTDLSVRIGTYEMRLSARSWVNSGLMTFFFLVVGLEARREFDMGELRDRRRTVLPLAAGTGGMLVPVAVYLAFNAGTGAAEGWGAAMSTDTAFALGMLAIIGRRTPPGLRVFILTMSVVDDFLALAVITVVYSDDVDVPVLVGALIALGVILLSWRLWVRRGVVYAVLALVIWVAFLESGVEPVVIGLAMGLVTCAYPASREDLERATGLFRLFREQPTPELERSVRAGLTSAVSPNERLQNLFHPWTSYAIVPLFALANAGIHVTGDELARSFSSPVTLGILVGYVAGKPVGVLGASALTTVFSRGRVRPPVGWGAILVGGTLSGVGFTVSLLIASLAFDGPLLTDAKIGILSAVICAFLVSRLTTGVIALLPRRLRVRALLGRAETIIDLAVPVDPARDHVRGPQQAPVTVVEYGDYECPYCGEAEPVLRELLRDHGDVRYVWRHLPLTDVHVHAQIAAEAAEAAASQGRYWEMHSMLMDHQGALRFEHLVGYAQDIGLDTERFQRDMRSHSGTAHVAEDVESADLSGVAGTPTFFVNGLRHQGAYDIDSLSTAVRVAKARTTVPR